MRQKHKHKIYIKLRSNTANGADGADVMFVGWGFCSERALPR